MKKTPRWITSAVNQAKVTPDCLPWEMTPQRSHGVATADDTKSPIKLTAVCNDPETLPEVVLAPNTARVEQRNGLPGNRKRAWVVTLGMTRVPAV